MPYVITEACVDVKDRACVDVCPVDCIYEGADQLYIHPIECIDCGVCAPVCPVFAIFSEGDVPRAWEPAVAENAAYFRARPDAARAAGKVRRRD
ncbi:MAG TPA: 4Fe-4S binding protein [Methylomirabilota bacterium]|nr:4Fe-4S binding protein [Methylomirabilota bacterium]